MENEIIYFLFSQRSYDNEKKIAEKLNSTFKINKVLSDGKWKEFTHKTTNPSDIQSIISDATIVATLKKSDIKII